MPPFRLQSLLNYREHQRDICRERLADVLAQDADLLRRKEAALAARGVLLDEIQALQQLSRIDVDQIAKRRFHAGQLTADAVRWQLAREELAGQIAQCRQELLKADQEVKVLEQLAEKQRQAAAAEREQRESREREEIWQAGQLARG